MHPSALRQRLCPYSICFLDVYLVCHGGGLATKRRQPLWTSVHNYLRVYAFPDPCLLDFFFLVGRPTSTSQNIRNLFFNTLYTRRRGVVGRVPATRRSGSIPGGVSNFNSYPGMWCMSFVCVLSCAVSGGGPDIVTSHSGSPTFVYV